MGLDVAPELVVDDVMHELAIASRFKHGDTDKCGVQEPTDQQDEEAEALRSAERLVYGWPSREADPTGAHSFGRFVKSFPLDFPMGIGDLYEERPRKVSPQVWVQHLLRYHTGHFVGGPRGQRVLWAMVNVLLLSEARQRGWGIYRNVVRRSGLGLERGSCVDQGSIEGDSGRGGSYANIGWSVVDGGTRSSIHNDAVGLREQEARLCSEVFVLGAALGEEQRSKE